jgi:phosphopantetheinyl transferase (holo-ACP synthase)
MFYVNKNKFIWFENINKINQLKNIHFLTKHELEKFKKFKNEKRSIEWLAARIGAKKLIKKIYNKKYKINLNLDQIEIYNDEKTMAPKFRILSINLLPLFSISLSHSNNLSCAFICLDKKIKPGVDIVYLENRNPKILEDFFTEFEQKYMYKLELDSKKSLSFWINCFWAVKEAVSKSLETGLNMDFKNIEIRKINNNGMVKINLEGKFYIRLFLMRNYVVCASAR